MPQAAQSPAYPIERDTYVTFTADELNAVKLETKKTLDLTEFVDVAQIDPDIERPYYIAPAPRSSPPKATW
jgi:DNA end-binding protein Ku